ncbi:hypothetical protein VP01_8g9, partial [Puccinia sorghi]
MLSGHIITPPRTTHTQYNTQPSSPGITTSSHPPTIPPVSTMRVTLRTFGNQFQEEVTQMVASGLTDPQIRQKIEETHSLTVSQRTLTR